MASSRLLFRPSFLSRFCLRTFASEVAISPAPRFEYYTPIELERAETAAELAEKAKKPWTELSKGDKIAIYRASFPYTIEEMTTEESQTKTIVGGVSMLLALSFAFFIFLRKYVSAESPRTINEEWVKASEERLRKQRANPITGICSK